MKIKTYNYSTSLHQELYISNTVSQNGILNVLLKCFYQLIDLVEYHHSWLKYLAFELQKMSSNPPWVSFMFTIN